MRMIPKYPKNDPYAYADLIVRYIVRKAIRVFGETNLLPFDELNVLHGAGDIYATLYQVVKTSFLRLARRAYADRRGLSHRSGKVARAITQDWVDSQLKAYDVVTKTVFENDFHRRGELFAEAVIATKLVDAETKEALKRITLMVKQEAITVTDSATYKADVDNGTEQVMWLTRDDEKRCTHCAVLHGEIFDLDDVPDKPHRNCRCWTVPYPFKED